MRQLARFRTLSRRASLRLRQGVILTAMVSGVFLVIVAGVMRFVEYSEKMVWESRQREAARNAARSVESFLQPVRDYMGLVGVLDRSYLESDPHVMYKLLAKNEALLEVVRVDAAGNVFGSASQQAVPVLGNRFTVPQSNWFLAAVDGRSYTGDVQISATDQPYLILAAPAADGGVVAARLGMNVLWEVVSSIEFGETGKVYVVDALGSVIAHPDPNVVLAGVSIAGRSEMNRALAAADGVWSGYYQNLEGKEVLGTSLPVGREKWLIYTEVDRAEASNMTRRTRTMGAAVALVFTAMANWATIQLLQREILEPIERLRDGAQAIRQGNLATRVASEREDEIGQVAAAFNMMAAELQRREASLEQARDQALAASRFKSRLLANVSHDLRTPLNAILGFTDMLTAGMYGHLTPPQQRVAERILANSKRLLALIESLLDRARIEAGKLAMCDEPFEPRRLVDEVMAIMTPFAAGKGLRLTAQVDGGLPRWIMGDRQRLYQVMMNLVENAVKFTQQGGVGLSLYASRERWAIEVLDTGPGIAPELQASVFEAFEQGDNTSTELRNGVGLGLSIVRDLATLMGGTVHLASTVGAGSKFTVSLPLVAVEEKEVNAPAGSERMGRG